MLRRPRAGTNQQIAAQDITEDQADHLAGGRGQHAAVQAGIQRPAAQRRIYFGSKALAGSGANIPTGLRSAHPKGVVSHLLPQFGVALTRDLAGHLLDDAGAAPGKENRRQFISYMLVFHADSPTRRARNIRVIKFERNR